MLDLVAGVSAANTRCGYNIYATHEDFSRRRLAVMAYGDRRSLAFANGYAGCNVTFVPGRRRMNIDDMMNRWRIDAVVGRGANARWTNAADAQIVAVSMAIDHDPESRSAGLGNSETR